MSLNANNVEFKGGDFVDQDPIEPGVYPARVVQVIDFGVQPQRAYKGQEKEPAQTIYVTYELVDEFMKDEEGNDIEDKPRWESEQFVLHNLRADRAKSTKRYLALDPKSDHDGDWTALVGTPCNVTIVNNPGQGKHEGKVFVNIGGVATMRDKDAKKLPELVNPSKVFDLSNPDMEVWEKLPEWMQDKIKSNLEYNASPLQAALGEEVVEEPMDDAEPGEGEAPW